MKTKIKIFVYKTSLEEFQKEINNWLKGSPHIRVIEMTQSKLTVM